MSELAGARPVTRLASLAYDVEMRERILELTRAEVPGDEIAAALTRERHCSPRCTDRVLPVTVRRIRLAVGLTVKAPRTGWRHAPDRLGVTAMAERMDIQAKWLHVQIRAGHILLDPQPRGAYLFNDTPDVIASLRSLRERTIEEVDVRASQPTQEGHQHG